MGFLKNKKFKAGAPYEVQRSLEVLLGWKFFQKEFIISK